MFSAPLSFSVQDTDPRAILNSSSSSRILNLTPLSPELTPVANPPGFCEVAVVVHDCVPPHIYLAAGP